MKRVVIVLVISLSDISVALADFPSHADICVDARIKGKTVSVVSKERLAKGFLNQSPDRSKLYINASDVASKPEYAPQWRRIFTDPEFCKG
jgi:hypothetical protein